ncbi:MAG: LPS assembly lipoprotein LptE [Bacteroidales bacterium]|nr:LPS assembly lipoprotein LptE [Bacteroidales bacterium]
MTSGNIHLSAHFNHFTKLPVPGRFWKRTAHLFTLLVGLSLAGCGVYSFTGASIPPEAKTITIVYFVNNAQYIEPSLSQSLTDALRDRFLSQTSLDFISEGGDLQLEGAITEFSTRPVAIQGNETAALNRLSVTVKVKYTNLLDPTKDFETPFTRFEDYPSNQDLSAVKDQLISLINEALVDDIFNKAVVNW